MRTVLSICLLVAAVSAVAALASPSGSTCNRPLPIPRILLAHVRSVFESFEEGKGRWVTSKHKDFTGVWDLDTSDVVAPSNTRLMMSSAGQRHAIFHTLSSLLQIGSDDFVFQYEVSAANGFGCDGAYVKLLQKSELNEERLHAGSPYTIMFGPDKCGSTNKVHFIFQHKNPITGVFEEKHLRDAPAVKLDKRTHLYTLVIRPDNSFEILIDGESAKKGSLLEDFEPPVNPPEGNRRPHRLQARHLGGRRRDRRSERQETRGLGRSAARADRERGCHDAQRLARGRALQDS